MLIARLLKQSRIPKIIKKIVKVDYLGQLQSSIILDLAADILEALKISLQCFQKKIKIIMNKDKMNKNLIDNGN
jgi:hypothetical protein